MNITKGWSSEFARQKFSVLMDETDLVSLLVEAGLDPDKVTLPMDYKFALLDLEADRFSQRTAVQAGEVSKETGQTQMQQFLTRRAQMLARLAEVFPEAVRAPSNPPPVQPDGAQPDPAAAAATG